MNQDLIEEGAARICASIEAAFAEGRGALIGRNGTIELQALAAGPRAPLTIRQVLETNAGIFPSKQESVAAWAVAYKKALEAVGTEPIVAGWYEPTKVYERSLLEKVAPFAPHIPLRSLEPYYVSAKNRWTTRLAGKRVAVITSFAKSVQAQLARREAVWEEMAQTLLPATTTWLPIQTGYAPCLAQGNCDWPDGIGSWAEAVNYLVKKVMEAKPDACIIGCGGLGMILGAELKARGVVCIVMGGATQVLFGIKGNRWVRHEIISRFWNDAWVWPAEDERPSGARIIEGACYWGGQGARKN